MLHMKGTIYVNGKLSTAIRTKRIYPSVTSNFLAKVIATLLRRSEYTDLLNEASASQSRT